MSHSESDEEYYSALEEESPRPRVMAMVRIRERRSRLDGALAMVRQRRQLEEKGRYLRMQIEGVAAAARERLIEANAKVSLAKEDVELAERVLRRTLGSSAVLRRLAIAVEHSGELPLGLTIEIGHEPRCGLRPASCRSVTSSAWTPSTASLPSANAATTERLAASFEEAGVSAGASASEAALGVSAADGTRAASGTGAVRATAGPATPKRTKPSAATSADRDETEASTSSDPSALPSRAISRRGSSPCTCIGASDPMMAAELGKPPELFDCSQPILQVGFPPLKLERRWAQGRTRSPTSQPRRPRVFVE